MTRKQFEIERRQFLAKAGGIASFVVAHQFFPGFSLLARADGETAGPGEDHFFVCIEVTGGWDVTLGLDPQILGTDADQKDMFVEYRPEEIIDASGLRLAPAAAPMKAHAADCAVINGISMRADLSHENLLVYMSSGRSGNVSASLPVELAALRSVGPLGVLYNKRPYLMAMGERQVLTSSFEEVIKGSKEAETPGLDFGLGIDLDVTGSPLEEAMAATARARKVAADLSKRLKEASAGGTELKHRHVLAAAFASGAAYQGRINTFTDPAMDTHSSHEKTHLRLQKEVWQDIADLFALFKATPYKDASLFDHTTFLVISEFSRTPSLNASRGKDHNYRTNSALLAGKGVQGGKRVGGSLLIPRTGTATASQMSRHTAAPFNYETQSVTMEREGASLIFPENVVRTVTEIFGVPVDKTAISPQSQPLSSIMRS